MKLDQIKQQLDTDEVIAWHGTSNTKKMFAYGDYMYIPFSIMWVGFVIFLEYFIIIYNYPITFHLLSVPMVLIGLYMAIGRFVYKYFKKKNSCYVLTNKRVIEAYENSHFGYKEKKLSEIGRMVRFVEKDGYGTLIFDDINPAYIMKLNNGMEQFRNKTKKVIGFYDFPEAEALFQQIQSLKSNENEETAKE
jgi:hypothetical protein